MSGSHSARNVAIVGAQWGDEGKGKVVDLYSAQADWIVRFQGGNNAGHTLVVNGVKTVLHLIPSGVLHKGKRCLIANGVVFDPKVFFKEIDALIAQRVIPENAFERISVSEHAHVILSYHALIDRLREEKAAGSKIGTTARGIGPAYEDKVARRGIQVIDLTRPRILKQKLERALEEKNVLLKHHFNAPPISLEPLLQECLALGERLKPYIRDVRTDLTQAIALGERVLFEGAQGTLLDVDHGTYPYVTSSNTVSGGALTGTGLGPQAIHEVIGITKAYTTRVGAGPFPSELEKSDPATAQKIRDIGHEYGATTGRPRRVGWLDLVALKYAVETNGLTGLALMKADVLNAFDQIGLVTAYRLDGQIIKALPGCIDDIERLEPVVEMVRGWGSYDASKVQKWADLPLALQDYGRRIEQEMGIPIVLLSVGPGREETLELRNPFLGCKP